MCDHHLPSSGGRRQLQGGLLLDKNQGGGGAGQHPWEGPVAALVQVLGTVHVPGGGKGMAEEDKKAQQEMQM